MGKEIADIAEALSNERVIPKEKIYEAMELALATATKKKYKVEVAVRVVIDRKDGSYRTYRRWTVVDHEGPLENPSYEISLEAARLEAMIEDLEEMITGCAIGQGMGGGGTPSDKMSAYVARKDELESRLKALRRDWAAESQAAILLTGDLPDLQRESLRAFYLRGHSARRIAADSHYSLSSVYKALAAGRKALRLVPENVVDDVLPGFYVEKAKEEEERWKR